MTFEVSSNSQLNILEVENVTKIICPRNSEGTIHFVVDNESSFELIIEENAHWTINVEYPNGTIGSKNNIEIKEYASLKDDNLAEAIFGRGNYLLGKNGNNANIRMI